VANGCLSLNRKLNVLWLEDGDFPISRLHGNLPKCLCLSIPLPNKEKSCNIIAGRRSTFNSWLAIRNDKRDGS
jgi:hypothetical protein